MILPGQTHRPTPDRFTTGKYESRLHREETTNQEESAFHRRNLFKILRSVKIMQLI